MGCKFSTWLIPSLVCGAAIFLCFALSFYILKNIRKAGSDIFQDRQWRLVTSQLVDNRVTKSFKIASLTQKKDPNEIKNILIKEIDAHQNEGEAICYLKVCRTNICNYFLKVLYCLPAFRTYWILWHLQTFKAFSQLNRLGAEKLIN